MKNMTSLTQNQNQIEELFPDSNIDKEPNIRKAKFIVTSNRIYTLEFDQNIEMQELKTMIQKAAHLRKNGFGLYIKGEDYTQFTDETFDSLFPEQDLVVFTLELEKGEIFDETELLLQINNPCLEHEDKFLLYYCFDCGQSICSECFTNGKHKGHKIQDKCFYLLPSKYLVDRMFSNWSKKPYEDFNISVDLNEYKNQLNNIIFKQLFERLKEVKRKCNELIDKYNLTNQNSLGNIRDSIRDIKISCIKALDEYKDLINIKEIINSQEVFLDFDHIYKDIGKKQKENFQNNLLKFQELNKGVSIFVQNLINDICQMINNTLLKAIDNKQYDEVQQKINLKLIKPVNKEDIINQLSDKKIKIMRNKKFGRKTMNNNYNNLVNKISEGVEYEFDKNKKNNQSQNFPGRNSINPKNLNSINNFENNNNLNINNDYNKENTEQNSNNNFNEILSINDIKGNKNNYSIDSTLQKSNQINNDNNNEIKNNMTQLLNNTNINYSNNPVNYDLNSNPNNNIIISNKNENKNDNQNYSDIQMENSIQKNNESFEKPKNIFEFLMKKDNNQNNNTINNNNPFTQKIDDISIEKAQQIEEKNNTNNKKANNIFGSIFDNNNNNNSTSNNIFNTVSNKKANTSLNIFSGNDISPIADNKVLNSNNICSNNSSFNSDLNNINSAQTKREIIRINNDSQNNQIPLAFENNNNNNNQISSNENSNQNNLILSSPFSQINSNNNNIFNNKNLDEINSLNINSDSNNSAGQNKNININDKKYLSGLAKNCKTILEEANESGSDIKNQKEKNINVEYYLRKEFILCPIPTTDKAKIITQDQPDENIISINFPQNLDVTTFLYNCSYCNYYKKLYISGGTINPGPSQKISNKFYMIDLSKVSNNNNPILIELSPMLYNRSNHSMIGYNNEIYAVGGDNLNSVEKYDIEKEEWIEICSMIKKRSNTMLAIYNDYLYAFFGKGEADNNYPESIERVNITNNNNYWEMILYSNPNNINTKLYGCGLYEIDELIYFLGGKTNEVDNDEIFYFHLNDRRLARTDSKLNFKESFRENKLFKLGEKIVQISDRKFSGIYLTIYVR